ncbi:SMC-Scp complex subunit ScpB [Candidatus Micrarchaeota archaeon]|nr:SMC-Scp complex subunit ScpB [Candidatus Micrarchaeota archaeon]
MEIRQNQQTQAKELEPRRIIEAALFMSAKPLSLTDLSKLTKIAAIGFIEEQIKNLQQEYEEKDSALQISLENGSYVMRIRTEYLKFVRDFAQEAEIGKGALKVLALISQNEGILQSKLVKMLGASVYIYAKELSEKQFVITEKRGRSKIFKLTQKFKDYFA